MICYSGSLLTVIIFLELQQFVTCRSLLHSCKQQQARWTGQCAAAAAVADNGLFHLAAIARLTQEVCVYGLTVMMLTLTLAATELLKDLQLCILLTK